MAAKYGGLVEWAFCCVAAIALLDSLEFEAIENLWGKPIFGYSLAGASAIVWGIFTWHVPPSGYAITALAVIAGIMALRPEMRGREKFLWFAILLAFMVVEIRAINKDRIDQQDKFAMIAGGLKSAVQKETEAIQQSQRQFAVTLGALDANIKMITGGNSFCYVDFIGNPELSGGTLLILFNGKYPLYDVFARVTDSRYTLQTKAVNNSTLLEREIGNIGIPGASVGRIFAPILFKTPGEQQDLNVFFNGRNGFWTELLRMRRIKGTWVKARLVEGTLDPQHFPNGARLLQEVDKGFPQKELDSDKDWTNAQKLPMAN